MMIILNSDRMRKVILFSLLAFSVNAYSQITNPALKSRQLSSVPGIELRKGLNFTHEKSPRIPALNINVKSSVKKGAKGSSLTPMYDDVYTWNLQLPLENWAYNTRTINLVYDESTNLLSYVTQKWDGSAWKNDGQVTSTYTTGNLTGELWQKWNGTAWINDYKYIKTYNSSGSLTLESGQSWNVSDWANDFQSLYTYNADNNLINFRQQLWNGIAWENSYQEISTYNSDKNLDTKLSQFWDGSAWTDGFRDHYTYDSGKKLVNVLEESFGSAVWENFSQSTFTYDTYNNLINELVKSWNGSDWENYTNDILAYDSSNNLKSKTSELWDGASWVTSSLTKFTYDINNYLQTETNKAWTSSILTAGDSTYYNIHTVVTALDKTEAETDKISLFPNPSYGKVTLKSNNPINKIEIYDQSGKRVFSDPEIKQRSSYEIDLSDCIKGIYIMKISAGSRIINKKLIIH